MTRCLVNPLCLFGAIWGTATALYMGGVWAGMFPQPLSLTMEVFLLNAGTFSLGYLTWSLWQSLPPRHGGIHLPPASSWAPVSAPGDGQLLTSRRLRRALQITLLVGLAALVVEVYRLALLARSFNTMRERLGDAMSQINRASQELEAKVADLEGALGRKAQEIDFFDAALRTIAERRQKRSGAGETPSTEKSAAASKRKAD